MTPATFPKISISRNSKHVSDIAFKSFIRICTSARITFAALILFLSALISFNASAQYQSLCWRISGNGLKHPAYLYGAMHVTDPRVFNLSDKANKAFEDSKVYAMELDPEKALSLTTLTKMMMIGGNKISTLIPDSDYHFLDSIVRISSGYGMALYNTMEPIIVSSILEEYGSGAKKTKLNMKEALDFYLSKKAKEEKKKVIGIETVDEQIEALHSLSYPEQALLLIEAIDEIRQGKKATDGNMMKFYLAQDLDTLLATNNDDQMPPKLYKALITDRNIKMADRIAIFIHKKPTFIAVGALHLPGPGGVIALLRKKGYTVEMWK
jgi:uncharacterized protein